MQTQNKTEQVLINYMSHWPSALALYSDYLKIKRPLFCETSAQAQKQGLSQSFAMIRLSDHTIVLDIEKILQHGLEDYGLEILAHELGHHVYCPADLTAHARMLIAIQKSLFEYKQHASMVANLYADLLINTRLFREYSLRIDEVYQKTGIETKDELWLLYMRSYEILWALPSSTLAVFQDKKGNRKPIPANIEGDAQLVNRLIRNYARDWHNGAARFASICMPYFMKENNNTRGKAAIWLDAELPGKGSDMPSGLADIDTAAITGIKEHPSQLSEPSELEKIKAESGQAITPFEYGQLLRSMGIDLTNTEIFSRFYKERALPNLVPFPVEESQVAGEPLVEGTEIWGVGDPFHEIDWVATASRNPVVIPGYTTLKRVFGVTEGAEPDRLPVNLDVYIDCSGSMPNPHHALSYLTLAGVILSLSALRMGAAVQATLWSGAGQFITTGRFLRNEKQVLAVVCDYLSGATAFPVHILRDTYLNGAYKEKRKTHILVISDDGVTSMFNKDEKGNKGFDIAQKAMQVAGGGGTFVLNLYRTEDNYPELKQARDIGFDIHQVQNWQDLVEFSKAFARRTLAKKVAI